MATAPIARVLRVAWDTVGRIVARVVSDRLDERRRDGLVMVGCDEQQARWEAPQTPAHPRLDATASRPGTSGAVSQPGPCRARAAAPSPVHPRRGPAPAPALVPTRVALALVGASLVAKASFVLGGLALVRAPLAVYRALTLAPVLMARKVGLYVKRARRPRPHGLRPDNARDPPMTLREALVRRRAQRRARWLAVVVLNAQHKVMGIQHVHEALIRRLDRRRFRVFPAVAEEFEGRAAWDDAFRASGLGRTRGHQRHRGAEACPPGSGRRGERQPARRAAAGRRAYAA